MPWVCRCSMITPEGLRRPASHRRRRVNRCFVEGIDETAGRWFDSLPAAQRPDQDRDRVGMVKALRRWLEANELLAVVTGVVGALVVLSLLLVLGGYLIVTR